MMKGGRVYLRHDQATSVVGRPGKRRSRQTVAEQSEKTRPRSLHVGAELFRSVWVEHNT